MKKLKVLRIMKGEEILGIDAVETAHNKGLDLKPLIEKIEEKFPEYVNKGCWASEHMSIIEFYNQA